MSGTKVVAISMFVVLVGAAQLFAEALRSEGSNCPNYWAPNWSCSWGGDQGSLRAECVAAIVGTQYSGCTVAEDGHSCSVSHDLNCHFVSS